LSKGKNIVKLIKGQRISWLGHLERMKEDRMPKKIFTQELERTRRRVRPRKGRRKEVERDLQVLGVRRWRELVIDRENGEVLFDRPKPTAGCSANERRRRRRRRNKKKKKKKKNKLEPFHTRKDKANFVALVHVYSPARGK
jgi:hypothetical protein